jgi:hypothetical protein
MDHNIILFLLYLMIATTYLLIGLRVIGTG